MPQSIRRYNTDGSTRSTGSRHSNGSQDSNSTAPTSLYGSPRPSLHQDDSKQEDDISPSTTYYARSSTETYASTNASEEELVDEPESYDPEYDVPEYEEVAETLLRPSNPSNFADYFPSSKRLYIRHDDTSYDGNMALRVDTEGKKGKGAVQLFYMRMYDLKKRHFSLRRYERSSGKPVCESSRKYAQPAAEKRPAITRSVSNAFASITKPAFHRTNSAFSTHSSHSSHSQRGRFEMKRSDSGYASSSDHEEEEEVKSKAPLVPTNTTKLEFSNYAQVEVKRRGAKSSKRYEFEYWGNDYAWKRVTKKDGRGKEVSYHLYKGDSVIPIAHIVPELRTPGQMKEELRSGGWGPPCSMWISDKSVLEALTDVGDVIVATGLIALIDDCIKRHFKGPQTHKHKHHHQVNVPLTPLNMELVSPKTMMNALFKRRDSGASAREREMRGSPLRWAKEIEAAH